MSPDGYWTVPDTLRHQALARAEKIALVDGAERLPYGKFFELAERCASVLISRGLRAGERVGIFMPRSIDMAVALFGVWLGGGVAVIVNDMLKRRQVEYICTHADVSLVVSTESMLATLEGASLRAEFVDLEHSEAEGRYPLFPRRIGDDLAMLIYTSGSTGMPKGIMLTHANLLAGVSIVSEYLKITDQDVLVSLLPFSFDYGLNQLLTSVAAGGTLVIERSAFPADICATLSREHVTGMAGVPAIWQQLAHPRSPFIKTRFPDLRYITNTGGRMPEAVTRLFRSVHPSVEIFLMYGLTEAFRSTYLPPDQVDRIPNSIGRAIPNVEILVLNEKGERCRTGEVGELVHRGPTVAMGYWRDAEATAKRFRPLTAEEVRGGIPEVAVYSGDYVYADEDGFLYYVGRKDQLIKSRGMRVSPEEVEECIYSSELVTHVVAFGVAANGSDMDIVAAYVPRDEQESGAEQLAAYCAREMPEYMQPKSFWRLDSLPQTSSNKPDRTRIKEIYVAGSER